MKALIDLSEVEDQLEGCKPGDAYSITFTVDAKTGTQLTGTASEVEHAEAENEEEDAATDEEYPEEKMPHGRMGGKKMPKAILLIAK